MKGRASTRGNPLWLFSLLSVSIVTFTSSGNASPCDGVDRTLTAEHKAALAPVISEQLRLPKVEILQSFKSGTWSILYVDTFTSDETFLFFPDDPLSTHYIASWSGGATSLEEDDIRAWTKKNSRGIPENLAACFAYHVARDRDR